MKAILVFNNMPTNCNECEVECDGYTAKQYAEKGITRPSWCPLRPLPSKRKIPFTKTFGTPFNKGKAKGWNDCIDAIISDTDGTKGEK